MNGFMLGPDLAYIAYCVFYYRSSRARFMVDLGVWRGWRIVMGRVSHLSTLGSHRPKAELMILVSCPDEMGILLELAVFRCFVIGSAASSATSVAIHKEEVCLIRLA